MRYIAVVFIEELDLFLFVGAKIVGGSLGAQVNLHVPPYDPIVVSAIQYWVLALQV